MKNVKANEIDRTLRAEGVILRTISPFGSKTVQKLTSPLSAAFFKLFSLKSMGCVKTKIARPDGSTFKVLIFRGGRETGSVLGDTAIRENARPRVGILWLHGGGYVLGAPEMVGMSFPKQLLKNEDCVVVAPEYTLSAKSPYPAALEDAYSTLLWMMENREKLGIETGKFMVGGESAGGGLTCALTQYARDKGHDCFAFQMPLYPMIDDRPTETNVDNDAPVWDSAANRAAWSLYLEGLTVIPPYAAPARATDLTGLPPAISVVGDIEPFYAETKDYFARLEEAGVPAKLRVFPGCYHAFDMMAPYSKRAKEANAFLLDAYREYCEKYLYGE